MIANRTHPALGGFPKPRINSSPYPGLREIAFGDDSDITPEGAAAARARGADPYARDSHAYVEGPGSDYSAIIDCDPITCIGHVHLSDSHLQYRFMIPAEAIVHCAEFVAMMNSSLRSWTSK
jgi:hypothetical protein